MLEYNDIYIYISVIYIYNLYLWNIYIYMSADNALLRPLSSLQCSWLNEPPGWPVLQESIPQESSVQGTHHARVNENIGWAATKGLCLSVCLLKTQKTAQRINLALCVCTIYDNGREVSYLKSTSEVALLFIYLFFSNFPSEAKVSLNMQTQPGDVLRHD